MPRNKRPTADSRRTTGTGEPKSRPDRPEPTTGTSSNGVAPARKPRDPYLDNAKVAIITLVVVGHAVEMVRSSGFADGVYTWIYLFHMPAFVAVSGYLSRSFTATRRQSLALVSIMIVPYLVFQTILSVERFALSGTFTLNFFRPGFAMWYLLALVVWRLLAPLLRSIPHPLLISIVISILSVTFGGISQDLSGARILSFLPFFTLGLVTTPEQLERFKQVSRSVWIRALAVALLGGALVTSYLLRDWIARGWLYMSGREHQFGMSDLELILLRCCLLATAFALTIALFALFPQRRNVFTSLGAATLGVYLLHVAIVYPFRHVIAAWDGWSVYSVSGLILVGVLLSLALATPPVQRATRWLFDPINSFGFLHRYLYRETDSDLASAPKIASATKREGQSRSQ